MIAGFYPFAEFAITLAKSAQCRCSLRRRAVSQPLHRTSPVHRFEQVVVEAGLVRLSMVFLLPPTAQGEDDNAPTPVSFADAAACFIAVHFGKTGANKHGVSAVSL